MFHARHSRSAARRASSVIPIRESSPPSARPSLNRGVSIHDFIGTLKETFDLRQESDYQPMVRLIDEKAQEVLGWAKEFVAACRKLCE